MSAPYTTSSSDVLRILDECEKAGVRVWIDGGWGVDALLGAQHRPHSDLDLVVPLGQVSELTDALHELGYGPAENHLPTRAVLRTTAGLQIDLHPITFDSAGDGWQSGAAPVGSDCRYPRDGFVTGTIGRRTVPCLGAAVQLDHHCGYEPRPHDFDDMRRLAQVAGLELPSPYSTDRRDPRDR